MTKRHLDQDLDFQHLDKVLELNVKNSKEAFEAFGVKFPLQITMKWGIVLGVERGP